MTNITCSVNHNLDLEECTQPTADTYFADEILKNMDKGLVTGSVFIDLAKAFDTVDHDILISKLKYYGDCDESLAWFKNYFSGRKQLCALMKSVIRRACHYFWSAAGVHPWTPVVHCLH